MSTEGLVYSHKIPLDEFCRNLISAWAYTARYFDSQVLFVSSAPELVRVVEDAHPYLDAHMDTLHDFGLSDSRYGLALCGHVACIVNLIPTMSRQQEWTRWRLKTEEFNRDKLDFNVSHCLPSEEEYMANASYCVAENNFCPFRMHSLPAPHRPQVTALSAKPSADVAVTMPPPRPCPTMIRQPEPAREPAVPPALTLKVEGIGSTARKHQRVSDTITPPSVNLIQVKRSTRSSKAIQPGPPAIDAKPTKLNRRTRASSRKTKAPPPAISTAEPAKKSVFVGVSDGEVESESGGEGGATDATTPGWDHEAVDTSLHEDILIPLVKRLHLNRPSVTHPPPPHAYHPVTSEPLPGLKYVSFSAFSKPAQPVRASLR
ncbi:hypothetical protein IW261DRAFT_1555584 [Armillaria novae-zelandiae]|uniref:Uncharacterized protein n=1 Tax=Armillaria novae-zelandiae TaxID=153914 RepID=A0AA39TIH1_9AGAR|nr:hypothetical protein IW261DRAFT_1555584 [Armillaria novae-zelandiae]